MYNKPFIKGIVLFFFIILLQYKIKAQDLLNAKSLENVKIDNISDADLLYYLKQVNESGLTEEQADQTALKRGMPSSEIIKRRSRLAALKAKSKNINSDSKSKDDLNRFDDQYEASTHFASNKVVTDTKNEVFGSELFGNPTPMFETNSRIPTPKNYVLGTDDEVIIEIFGYQEANYRLPISPNGGINIPFVGVVPLVGITVEQATRRIKDKMMHNGYSSLATGKTQIVVSTGNIRSIKITVIGEAKRPGTYNISSLSSLFNALYLAGGPTVKGSLRQIELIRNNKVISVLDAYDFLLKGDQTKNLRLVDQDVIRIPTAKIQVHVAGEVKREGVYEMLQNENLSKLLNFTGGFSNNAYSASVQVLQITDKEKKIKDVTRTDYDNYLPQKGDSIFVGKILNRVVNKVSVTGAVYRPGVYELENGFTISKLIQKADGLKEDAFTNRGLLIRINDTDLSKKIFPFNVLDIMKNVQNDLLLQKNDEIIVGNAAAFTEKYQITLEGEVRKPGVYPFFTGMTLNDLLFLSEGLTDASYEGVIEIARRIKKGKGVENDNKISTIINVPVQKDLGLLSKEIQLEPWDIIEVRKKNGYTDQISVKVQGEVNYPGSYELSEKDERVSTLLKRAGGLTNDAFISAASLIRINRNNEKYDNENERIKKIQDENRDTSSVLRELNNKSTIKVGLDLKNIINNPNSPDDIFLQEGDELYIPKQKNEVRVNGEVMVTSEIVFKKGEPLKYYIDKAGGFTDRARQKRIYVLYPNGNANRIKRFLFFKKYPEILPGSEILVPRELDRKNSVLSTAELIGLASATASLAGVVIAILKL